MQEGYRNFATILLTIITLIPILLLKSLGLFLKRRMARQLSPILLFGLGYTGVNVILVGTTRYRLPLQPFLLIFADAATSYLIQAVLFNMARARVSGPPEVP